MPRAPNRGLFVGRASEPNVLADHSNKYSGYAVDVLGPEDSDSDGETSKTRRTSRRRRQRNNAAAAARMMRRRGKLTTWLLTSAGVLITTRTKMPKTRAQAV